MASEAFKLLIDNLQRTSRLDANVIISGEVGTGRRQCAMSIHKASRRSNERFVTVNCTALNDHRFGIEMFGLQNSAFEMVRKGALFLAEEGTLYLHEVHELTPDMQAQLVRSIESGVFSPVGSNDVIASNVRIVSSTSVNLKAYVEAGRFRNDLFHLLAQMVIVTPTLNERIDDIDLLATNILREIAPGQPYQLDRLAYNRLLTHSFTGNLIELKNIMLRAISQSPRYVISEEVMISAINGGSIFGQAQDHQDQVAQIESSLSIQAAELSAPQDHNQISREVGPAEPDGTVADDLTIRDSNRKGRWSSPGEHEVDESVVTQKLHELSDTNTSSESIKPNTDVEYAAAEAYASKPSPAVDAEGSTSPTARQTKLSMKDRELLYIKELLNKYNGDKDRVAKELGCTTRTLYRKIERIKEKRL